MEKETTTSRKLSKLWKFHGIRESFFLCPTEVVASLNDSPTKKQASKFNHNPIFLFGWATLSNAIFWSFVEINCGKPICIFVCLNTIVDVKIIYYYYIILLYVQLFIYISLGWAVSTFFFLLGYLQYLKFVMFLKVLNGNHPGNLIQIRIKQLLRQDILSEKYFTDPKSILFRSSSILF